MEPLTQEPPGLLCVAADPVRWRLLAALAGGTRCVCELRPAAGVSAPALSHHLKVLRLAGLVSAARRGRRIDYTLAPDAAARLRAALPVPAPGARPAADREGGPWAGNRDEADDAVTGTPPEAAQPRPAGPASRAPRAPHNAMPPSPAAGCRAGHGCARQEKQIKGDR